MATGLSRWGTTQALEFARALSAAGLPVSVARSLIADPEAMRLWAASATMHLSAAELKRREEAEAREAGLWLSRLTLEEVPADGSLAMSVRVYNCLKRAGANTVEDIATLKEMPRPLSDRCLEYLRDLLTEAGLALPNWLSD